MGQGRPPGAGWRAEQGRARPKRGRGGGGLPPRAAAPPPSAGSPGGGGSDGRRGVPVVGEDGACGRARQRRR